MMHPHTKSFHLLEKVRIRLVAVGRVGRSPTWGTDYECRDVYKAVGRTGHQLGQPVVDLSVNAIAKVGGGQDEKYCNVNSGLEQVNGFSCLSILDPV